MRSGRWPLHRALLLALAGMLAACSTTVDTPSGNRGMHDYLALGDSYTIGEGVAESDRWPMQLARGLRGHGIALSDPRIIARTGWTTDELDTAINAAQPQGEYAFVSLLIGVNNQYRGRDVDNYRVEFAALLERAIGFTGGRKDRMLVLSIPDWGATRFGGASGRDLCKVSSELDAYNAAARAICSARGVAFVDITPVSRARGRQASMAAEDGLHPSAEMYAAWTRQALPVARQMFSAP